MSNGSEAVKTQDNLAINDFDINFILKIKGWTEEEFKIAEAVIAGTRIARQINSEEKKPSQ